MARGYLSEVFVSFQGEGLHAGRRHLFLRLAGCHLRCRYCDTPGSLERTPTARLHLPDGSVEIPNPIAGEDLLRHVRPLLADGDLDGLAVTGGEPLLQPAFLAELLSDASWPRPRMLETSGTQPDRLEAVLPLFDAVSMDIKLPSNSGEQPTWDEHRRFLALAGDKAYVKVLVDETTAASEVEQAAALVRDTVAVPVFLQPITAADGRVAASPAALERFFAAARRQVRDVRVLPQTHKMMAIL